LEARIETLRQRKTRKHVQRDPAIKELRAAVRSIDLALAASSDHPTRQALGEARNTLTACLALAAATPQATQMRQPRRSAGVASEEALLSHVRMNPGRRGEEIAAALGSNAQAVRPVMRRLITAGKIRTQGRARAMRYATV
jgi:hypothetical protein